MMMIDSLTAHAEHTDALSTTSTVDCGFATMPVITAVPAYQPIDEEELHTSFEQAISERVIAVKRQLSLISGPLTDAGYVRSAAKSSARLAQPVAPLQEKQPRSVMNVLGNAWQRGIVFGGLSLMLLLTGFDLMGLLVLHLH